MNSVTAMPVFTATLLSALTIGSSFLGNHCITIGPRSVTTTAPPNPNTNRLSRNMRKLDANGESIEKVISTPPKRMVRLMPKRTASIPVSSGATTLATDTEVVIIPSCAMLT